jgi:ABC-type glycerol-3-phosphate transport system permease component
MSIKGIISNPGKAMESSVRAIYFKKIVFYIVISIIALITLFPFLYVTVASLQSEWTIMTGEVRIIPKEIHIENYRALLFTRSSIDAFGRNLVNSLKVSLSVMLLTVVVATMGAYGLSRYEVPGRELIAWLMLFMYVFPTVLIVTPAYMLINRLHLLDSHFSIILVHTALCAPFCTWLLRSFFDAIPKEIEEAAIVDGAGKLRVLLRIILPLASAGILTSGAYALIYSWAEYLFASVLINTTAKQTIPIALAGFSSQFGIEWTKLLAGSALNIVPILIIFIPMIRTFLRGFMEGAVKK